MSEQILKAIIQLLAIVAKEDDITKDEIAAIRDFLSESLSDDDARRYLILFKELAKKQTLSQQEEHDQIDKVCQEINQNQPIQQKIIVVLDLIELIAADGHISKRENELVYYIADKLNIDKKRTDLIKAFVTVREPNKINSSNLLIIDEGQAYIPEKCKRISVTKLDGFISVLRIPQLDTYFTKFIGDDEVTLNGCAMRNNYVYIFSRGSVFKSPGNDPVFQSDVAGAFRLTKEEKPLTFVASDIHYKFKNGKVGLQNINISEESGRLIGLMGGSGAGKSTLLNVLNGNSNPTQGSVRINGIDIHISKNKIEGVIGYVPQDDLLVEELTVYENLMFAAKLCFDKSSKEELEALVNKTLDALGLAETKDLKVGNSLEKSISGGQRKRVNIGLELLREPSVLFVDEPTSGLSSRDSENIMDLLKELAFKGKLVFVVIHQPSEDIFKMFDKLILLDVGGYQIYYGDPVEAITYFKDLTNMVDKRRSANPELLFNIIEAKVVNEFGTFTKKRKTSPKQWFKHFQKKIKLPNVQETTSPPQKTLNIPSRFKQFFIFGHRDLLSKLSNRQYLIVNFLEAPVLAALLAFITRYMPEDTDVYHFKENLNIPVFFFMSVIVALFMGLTVSAEEIIKDRKLLKRESFLNLSRVSYLFSKFYILFALSAFQTLTFVLISSWLLGIKGMTLSFWLILFSTSCFANMLGLNLSSAFKNAITVYVLIPLMIIPQLILSGVVVNFDKLNPVITTEDQVPIIGEVMASRWAYEAIMVSQFKNNKYERNFYPFDKIMAQAEFKTVYFIPRLESDLEFAHHHVRNESPQERDKVEYRLKTVRQEIQKELLSVPGAQFEGLEDLYYDKFNDQVFDTTLEFLETLRSYYNLRFNKADQAKKKARKQFTSNEESRDNFIELRADYENEAVAVLVKNTTTEHRILEHDNELIQKVYPVYMDHDFPKHLLDFRAQFYSSNKHIFGMHLDTLLFNTLVIWFMSIILGVSLYYDIINRLVLGFMKK